MTQKNEEYIRFFKALANEERIEMIKLLKKNTELCAQDVEANFYLEQSTTSHHLNTLRKAGIFKSRKDGRHIYYSLDHDQFKSMWEKFGKTLLS